MGYLADKYLCREINYWRMPENPRALIVIRHRTGSTIAYEDDKPDLCGIRENAPDSARDVWVSEAKAKGLAVLTMTAPAARQGQFDLGPDGKLQSVLPGAERASQAELARRLANAPLKPKAAQRPCDAGLFSDSAKQQDLF